MIRWAITFLIIALVAGFFGFSGIAASDIEIARLLFVVFVVLFLIAALVHALKGKAPRM